MTNRKGAFVTFDEKTLRELVPQGVVRTVQKNVVVLSEGDATDPLYVILSGRVKVFLSDEEGKEVILNTVVAGDYFGEIVLDGGRRSASIMTLEPCRFFVIPRIDVEGLIESNPEFSRDLIGRLIRKVRSLAGTVRDLALRDVYGRIASFLEEHVVEAEGQRILAERLTQQDLASRVGASREMVSRILRDLAAGGYVATVNKKLVLLKPLPRHW